MNDPTNLPLDIDEQRQWLIDHKRETGQPWSALQQRTGTSSALSQFAGGNYAGDNQKVAEAIFRYRQLLITQAEIAIEAPRLPGFFETPSSRRMQTMLAMAQRGRITLIATGPGTGKTMTVRHYRASVSNVWVATMSPSTRGVNNMQIEVLEALGEQNAKGTPQALSRRIRQLVRNTNGLIVIDEAQHLSEQALEEIRSWHDAEGIGICLVGNEDVLNRLFLGSRKDAFARLSSRVSYRLIFQLPNGGDAEALADAWSIDDLKIRQYVQATTRQPGGLRTATMMLELASMLAAAERSKLNLAHCQDAWAQLSTRALAA